MLDIRPISPERRNLTGMDQFLLWVGAAISLAEVWAGGMLAPLGVGMGIFVIVLGHLIGNTPFALGSIVGAKYGIPAMVSLRPSFGLRGSYIGSVLNVIQLTGWTAIMLIVSSDAAVRAYPCIGKSSWVVIIGVATTIWAIGGSKCWRWANRVGVAILVVVCALTSYYLLVGGYSFQTKGSNMPFGLALDIVIAMPVSWLPLICDYSRYSRSISGAFWGAWVGYFVGSSWMYILGLMAFLATNSSDVVSVLVGMGFTGTALVLILLSTITSTFLDIYSTAISSLNLFPRLNRLWTMVIAGAVGTVLGLIFLPDAYEGFLLLIGGMFCPIFGVVLADYFIVRKGRLVVEELYRIGGMYWYSEGVNWCAIFSWLLGFGVYEFITIRMPWIGASIPSMVVSGSFYLVMRRLYHEV
ncbi:MAG: putative hydroxymethylpyrimidine transporter CytX [Synergistetes bacterium]|nr:putative hydroxymethylpyrimidine transporter CytX [Synergistota bacterium]